MYTSRTYSLRTATAAAAVVAVVGLAAWGATASHAAAPRRSTTRCTTAAPFVTSAQPRLLRTTAGAARRWSYDWPVKPFDRQHPVRGFLDDPRIGGRGSRAFHFGIDVAVPDGTAVYAVEGGTVSVTSKQAIAVVAPGLGRSFGYWHIVPVVKDNQLVGRHQLLGRVAAGWGHVHFAERRDGVYLNPLRPGGLGPYVDRTAPAVDEIGFDGRSLVVRAHDTPDPKVPGAWAGEPVSPALLRWRVAGRTASAWRTAIDFRSALVDRSRFALVYTPRTRQNHARQPGLLCYYLARTWEPTSSVTIQVEASDTQGNVAVYSLRVAGTSAAGL